MREIYNSFMPRPKTKNDLIDLSSLNYEKMMAIVKPLPLKTISQAGACEHWSIKDILAHLHAWHLMYLRWYTEGMAGEKPEIPAPGYTWLTTPALNAEIFTRYNDTDLDEILVLLDESHHQIMEIIENHTDEELFTKQRYGWTGTTSLGSYTVSAMSSHYDWANKNIKQFIKAK